MQLAMIHVRASNRYCMIRDVASGRGPFLPAVHSRVACKAMRAGHVSSVAGLSKASEPLMLDFWVRLRELRATKDSLGVAEYRGHQFQVINLGGALRFPGLGRVTHVLRRDCYRVAHQALKDIWAASGDMPVVISGTPGTGTTVFLYDMMFEYAHHDHPILWHTWQMPDKLVCFGLNGVREGRWEAFEDELHNPDAIYLCDSVAPFEFGSMVGPKTVIVVSPHRLKEDFFNDLVKTAEMLWFPVPSDEEMYAAAPLYDVDEALCKKLMYRWGNVPRYVLQHAHDERQQRRLEEAIDSVSAKRIDDALRDHRGVDGLASMLVHVRATHDLAHDGVGLASVWVQLQLYERVKWYEGDASKRVAEFCTSLGAGLAAGAGGDHQGLAHRALKRGGWFLLRNHQGQQSVILLPPLRVVKVSNSEQVAELASWWKESPTYLRPVGIYALPSNPKFAAVDSAVIFNPAEFALRTPHAASASGSPLPAATGATGSAGGKAIVLGIQITTNHSHKINYPGWQSFSSATGSHTLAFVVPVRSWSTYPPQEFEGGPADAAQQEPCAQQVLTWVPVTADELNNFTVDRLRELGNAYGIDGANTLPREPLIRRLLEAEVPTEDFDVLKAALPKVCIPPRA